MASATAQSFTSPAIPWLLQKELGSPEQLDLGPGLDPARVYVALQRLWSLGGVQALVVFGSRGRRVARADSDLDLAVILQEPHLSPATKAMWWRRCRQAMGFMGVGLDLVVVGAADAQRLSGSRWHVLGDVAREGRVLCSTGLG